MNELIKHIREKVVGTKKRIVLPEGNDIRIIEASQLIVKHKIAKLTILGNKEEMLAKCPRANFDDIKVVDPKTADLSMYANKLYELRKDKGMTLEQAEILCREGMYLGVMMVGLGEADGLVGGACHNTGDMLRPGLQIIKTAPGFKTVSSCFVMVMPKGNKKFGDNGVFVFGDCAVNPEPTAEQLADIALASAKTASTIALIKEPRVALLSFSTKGSAKHPLVDKVRQAYEIVTTTDPDLIVNGEIQADAAIIETVNRFKTKNTCPLEGKSNVLIFPDLQAGNIGYKLVERLAGAEAIGPICQGFNKPLNDLSRGCNVEDIVNVVAITALQAQS